jgi:hypothetical protein
MENLHFLSLFTQEQYITRQSTIVLRSSQVWLCLHVHVYSSDDCKRYMYHEPELGIRMHSTPDMSRVRVGVSVRRQKNHLIAMQDRKAESLETHEQGVLGWCLTIARQEKNQDLADIGREIVLIGE